MEVVSTSGSSTDGNWLSYKLWMRIAVGLLLAVDLAAASQAPTTRIVPDDRWVEIYFSSIDPLAARMQLKPLRSQVLREGEMEIRMWQGFGLGPLRSYVIRRVGGSWSGLAAVDEGPRRRPKFKAVPRS